MGTRTPISPERRRDKWTGLAIIVLAFVGCMGLSVWGLGVSTPKPAPEPLPVSAADIPGFPEAVNPFQVLPRARGLSVRDRLRGFKAEGVRSDGTIDLTKSGNSIRYSFQSESGRGPQPARDPGTLPTRRFCGLQRVQVNEEGIVALPDSAERTCGSRPIDDLGEPDHCSLEQLWKLAQKKGFDAKKEAEVEYYAAEGGAAFRIVQKKHRLTVSALDCKTRLTGRDSYGSAP